MSIAALAGCLRGQKIDRKRLCALLAARDNEALAAFVRAGQALGVLVQNAWSTFNPQGIVLGGETVTLGGNALLDATRAILNDYASRARLTPPQVKLARYGDLAAAVGGAAYVLHAALHPHQPALHTRYAYE
jgi:predicted NBD/HSP70 family sugar kinase